MSTTRLVLIMGGGVSLGTYVAGALTEIYWALRQQGGGAEGDVGGAAGAAPRVQVEVLAGASAGAVSAALFARALTCAPAAIADLYRAWVRDISIDALLAADGSGFDPRALFSARKIDELARTMIRAPADYREWQTFCATPLRVGLTLSNLGGVRYRLDYANQSDTFFSTRIHADHLRFRIENPAYPELWDELRAAAVASSAFPAAFPPRELRRSAIDYQPALFAPELGPELPMWYVDGGVFDNEPVGLAKDLVEENPEHQRLDYRYLLIDPYLDEARAGSNDELYAGPASLPGVLGALATAVMGQSNAKDWIRANKVNWRLAEQREFISARLRPLVEAVFGGRAGVAVGAPGSPGSAEALAAGVQEQARGIAHFKRGVNRSVPPAAAEVEAYLQANLVRIAADPRYDEALRDLAGIAREVMLALIFIVESAAGLRDKEPMALYLIAPRGAEAHPLAGDFLHNFGGFFREEWREHDFLCGRRDARQVLTEQLLDLETGAPLFNYPPKVGVNYDPVPISASATDLTAAERHAFHQHLQTRLKPLIAPHLPWYARPMRGPIVRKTASMAMKALGFPG
jgi:predicted acylesterase/phospholipase RssA